MPGIGDNAGKKYTALEDVTLGTAAPSKAVTTDANGDTDFNAGRLLNNQAAVDAHWTNKKAISLDGSAEYQTADKSAVELANSTNTEGAPRIVVNVDDMTVSTADYIWSYGDANGDQLIALYVKDSKFGVICRNSGIQWEFTTDDTFDSDVIKVVTLYHDGTTPYLDINGITQAITFSTSTDKTVWFGDLTNIDTGRIGCLKYNSGANTQFCKCTVYDHSVTNIHTDPADATYGADYQRWLEGGSLPEALQGASTSNYVTNGGAESGDGIPEIGGVDVSTINAGEISQSAVQAHTGSNSLAVTGDGATSTKHGIFTLQTPLTIGSYVYYSCWVYIPNGNTDLADISLRYKTGSETVIASTTAQGAWTQLMGYVYIPSGLTQSIQIKDNDFTGATSETFYIDDIEIVQVGEVVALHPDGISPAGWTGIIGGTMETEVAGDGAGTDEAAVLNRPMDDSFPFKKRTITGETTLTDFIPAGYVIESIHVHNTTSNAVTNLDIGTTDAGGEIVNTVGISADESDMLTVAGYSTTLGADDTIYISAGNWNSASLDFTFTMRRKA